MRYVLADGFGAALPRLGGTLALCRASAVELRVLICLAENGGFENEEDITAALKKVISAKRIDMLEVNLGVLRLGKNY